MCQDPEVWEYSSQAKTTFNYSAILWAWRLGVFELMIKGMGL